MAGSGSPFHPDGDRWILQQQVGTAEVADTRPQRLLLVTNFFQELRRFLPD